MEMNWKSFGNLLSPLFCDDNGVYIFVFNGKPRRIIYVGTAFNDRCGFMTRWCDHIEKFRKGGRTLWIIEKDCDIYDLMSFQGKASNKNDAIYYYKELNNSKVPKVWMPGSYDKKYRRFLNHYTNAPFPDKIAKYVAEKYLPNIEIWACSFESKSEAKNLETQLQHSLSKHFCIGYYDDQPQSWLGKQVNIDRAFKSNFTFARINKLDLDNETNNVLGDLKILCNDVK